MMGRIILQALLVTGSVECFPISVLENGERWACTMDEELGQIVRDLPKFFGGFGPCTYQKSAAYFGRQHPTLLVFWTET